jgi:hypothetical protein
MCAMAEQRPSDILGALPRTRPQRTRGKRGARQGPAEQAQARKQSRQQAARPPRPQTRRQPLRQPAQPGGTPAARRAPQPEPPSPEILGTAAQAAAELAEIGLAVTTRALRQVVSRFPRP